MVKRITKEFLKNKEKRVNDLFSACGTQNSVRVSERNNATAVDMYDGSDLKDNIDAGLSKKEANILLNGLITGASVCHKNKN